MTPTPTSARKSEHGFTLLEALVALALTGLILSALATLTAQWLPSWNRGFDRIQQSELISIAMQRIAADLAAAEFVPASRATKKPLFEGTALSVTFVRTALGRLAVRADSCRRPRRAVASTAADVVCLCGSGSGVSG